MCLQCRLHSLRWRWHQYRWSYTSSDPRAWQYCQHRICGERLFSHRSTAQETILPALHPLSEDGSCRVRRLVEIRTQGGVSSEGLQGHDQREEQQCLPGEFWVRQSKLKFDRFDLMGQLGGIPFHELSCRIRHCPTTMMRLYTKVMAQRSGQLLCRIRRQSML